MNILLQVDNGYVSHVTFVGGVAMGSVFHVWIGSMRSFCLSLFEEISITLLSHYIYIYIYIYIYSMWIEAFEVYSGSWKDQYRLPKHRVIATIRSHIIFVKIKTWDMLALN